MPKIDAVSKRNCAMTVQLPAAISWPSSMISAVKANITAAMKDATAILFSTVLLPCVSI